MGLKKKKEFVYLKKEGQEGRMWKKFSKMHKNAENSQHLDWEAIFM